MAKKGRGGCHLGWFYHHDHNTSGASYSAKCTQHKTSSMLQDVITSQMHNKVWKSLAKFIIWSGGHVGVSIYKHWH